MKQEVVLVNELDEAIGRMEKMEAHQKALLHRAFSVFIFNSQNEMLLQQRAFSKYHSGGLWSNACCSHPFPEEEVMTGACRRLQEEMGFTTELKKAFTFTYKAVFDNGLTEYEFDHVFLGIYDGSLLLNAEEVHDYRFLSVQQVEKELKENASAYTAWFHIAFPKLQLWLQHQLNN